MARQAWTSVLLLLANRAAGCELHACLLRHPDRHCCILRLNCLKAALQLPHAGGDAGDVNEGAVHEKQALVPNDGLADTAEPGDQSLDDPALPQRRMLWASLDRVVAIRFERCVPRKWMSTLAKAARSPSASYALRAMMRFSQHVGSYPAARPSRAVRLTAEAPSTTEDIRASDG
jgi:hypothetical protein